MQSEAERMDAKLSNLDPYIILSNARRICKRRYERIPNWSLAMEIFGLGSTYAWALCHRIGVDGDGLTAIRSLIPAEPEAKEARDGR